MKKGQEKASNNIELLLLLAMMVFAVALYVIRDYGKGREFACEAGELGMVETDAERYRQVCLTARAAGKELPSPYDWARENAKAFEPFSVLDCLKHTAWAEEDRERQEVERLRLQQEEVARFSSAP
jgi:hypothetical protein